MLKINKKFLFTPFVSIALISTLLGMEDPRKTETSSYAISYASTLTSDDDQDVQILLAASATNNNDTFWQSLNHGASIYAQDERSEKTSLHFAAKNGHAQIIHALLCILGVNKEFIDIQDHKGNTALHLAAKKGYPEIVKLLLTHGADEFIVNYAGNMAAELADQRGHHHIATLIHNHTNTQLQNVMQRLQHIRLQRFINASQQIANQSIQETDCSHETKTSACNIM